MADLQGALPIRGIVAAVALVDGLNGVNLSVIEPSQLTGPLPRLLGADELKPEPTGIPGAGNFVPRGLLGQPWSPGSPKSFSRTWPRPKSPGVRLDRLAHTIRTPHARW